MGLILKTFLFFLLVFPALITPATNSRMPIFGMITLQTDNSLKHIGEQFLPLSLVNWISSAGAKVVPISYDIDLDQLTILLDQIDGVIIPGRGERLKIEEHNNFDLPIHFTLRKIFSKAIIKNDLGQVFPIFALEDGLHTLLTMTSGDLFLEKQIDALNYHYKLIPFEKNLKNKNKNKKKNKKDSLIENEGDDDNESTRKNKKKQEQNKNKLLINEVIINRYNPIRDEYLQKKKEQEMEMEKEKEKDKDKDKEKEKEKEEQNNQTKNNPKDKNTEEEESKEKEHESKDQEQEESKEKEKEKEKEKKNEEEEEEEEEEKVIEFPEMLFDLQTGIRLTSFQDNLKLRSFYQVIHTIKDRKGSEIIASIQAKKYPFYGVTWMVEKPGSKADPEKSIQQLQRGYEIAQDLALLVVGETRKNIQQTSHWHEESETIIQAQTSYLTKDLSQGKFKECYFFNLKPENRLFNCSQFKSYINFFCIIGLATLLKFLYSLFCKRPSKKRKIRNKKKYRGLKRL
ncbi:protease family c26 gamma-glutamyl hydrolase [Anaeramoeba flamelloides]|uniref:folate gamma-glutamyl hydrolase n=1 Tax=Anaeramoeba flamelloides TaxID=1746091 RepID=A0ABQ8Y3Y7_9EUKA|nr:protease family c26 gamma-glutamyl hydrolase [Anaeramoeba flamelloides]